MIALTALAEATTVSTAMYVGGAILALAAPLYLPARRQTKQAPAHGAGEPTATMPP